MRLLAQVIQRTLKWGGTFREGLKSRLEKQFLSQIA